jgi:hypothetical protein
MSRDVISHWLDLMNSRGWIPRWAAGWSAMDGKGVNVSTSSKADHPPWASDRQPSAQDRAVP